MFRKVYLKLFSVCLLLVITGCVVRYDGPYEGRIIDADTGKPIEGVVVLGVWYTAHFNVGGASHKFYDAQETVTDENGEFSIRGLGLKFFTTVESMNFVIFKSGYEHHGLAPWISLKEDYLLSSRIKWEGDKAIIPLKKLTLEERKSNLGPPTPPHNARKEKIKLMLEEINKDRREQGLRPINVGR
jgi:hypothetical protein